MKNTISTSSDGLTHAKFRYKAFVKSQHASLSSPKETRYGIENRLPNAFLLLKKQEKKRL